MFSGRYPDVSLEEARNTADKARALAPTTTTPTNPFNGPSCHSVDLAGFEAIA